jgi:hypothetical protein
VVEVPIDYSADLSRPFQRFLTSFDRAVNRKRHSPTFNILFHSWSLTETSERKYRELYKPEYETAFEQICNHVVTYGRSRTLGEYLRLAGPLPVVSTTSIRATSPKSDAAVPKVDELVTRQDLLRCNICGHRFGRSVVDSGRCPSCGSDAGHRQLRNALDTFGTFLGGRVICAQDSRALSALGLLDGAAAVDDLSLDSGASRRGTSDSSSPPGTVDCVVVMHRTADQNVLKPLVDQAADVLEAGGLFVSTLPSSQIDLAGLGVGVLDYELLLSKYFAVTSVPGYDPVTDMSGRVFIGQRQVAHSDGPVG